MSLDLSMLVRRVADLSARMDLMPSLRWGTVVTASPLTVRLDGDADAVGGLESLTGTLALGARVLVARWNRRGVVLGTSGQRGQVIVPTVSQTAVTGETGYSYSPGLVIYHYGAQHTMPICARWDAGAWTATDNMFWRVAVVPSGVAVPKADYTPVGTLNVQGMAHSLAYRTSTREIIAVPGSSQSVSAGRWMYGTASWIA